MRATQCRWPSHCSSWAESTCSWFGERLRHKGSATLLSKGPTTLFAQVLSHAGSRWCRSSSHFLGGGMQRTERQRRNGSLRTRGWHRPGVDGLTERHPNDGQYSRPRCGFTCLSSHGVHWALPRCSKHRAPTPRVPERTAVVESYRGRPLVRIAGLVQSLCEKGSDS